MISKHIFVDNIFKRVWAHFFTHLKGFTYLIWIIIFRRQLYKNVESNIEQVLAATPHKAPIIQSPTTYHENYTS